MRIADSPPKNFTCIWQYENDLEDGYFHDLDSLKEKVGQVICARLIMRPYSDNAYGQYNHEFSGDYALELTRFRPSRGGNAIVRLRTPTSPPHRSQEYVEEGFLLTEDGLLTKSIPIRNKYEDGYFPVNADDLNEELTKITADSPPIAPLALS
jgi:hypothetical protein